MKTAHQKSQRKHIPSATKCAMALQAIHRQQTITALSRQYHCSRTTVHAQKNRALEAAANAFDDAKTDEEVLFSIQVTNN